MATRRPSIQLRFIRLTDILFDGIGMRPLGVVVFAASTALLFQLIGLSANAIRTEGVATGMMVDHPSRVASFVTRVFVKSGDRVQVGAPLVELSPHFLDQRIERLDSEIDRLINESRLAQARLLVDEERWVAPGMRRRPARPSLEDPTAEYYKKQVEVLQTRRSAYVENRDSLLVTANFEGVVAQVAWLGASIAEGASVASVMPEYADGIVAYVPAETDPSAIADGAAAYLVGPQSAPCRAAARVRGRGAAVEEAPPQLKRLFRDPIHGMPVHISLPLDCELGNGQVLALDFRPEEGR